MKKITLLIIALFISVNITSVNADFEVDYSKVIIRNVITKIEWDDFNKRIVIHKITIQKDKANSIQTGPTESVIYGDSFEEKTLTDVQAEEFARKNDPRHFNSDIIFGHEVEVFKDLSGNHDVSQEEVDRWVKLAQEQVEKDYRSPPKFKESSNKWGKIISYMIYVVLAVIVYVVVAKVVRFSKKV